MSLAPSVEVGLRHDGGDAEAGAGIDVGAGIAKGHRPHTACSGVEALRDMAVESPELTREPVERHPWATYGVQQDQ